MEIQHHNPNIPKLGRSGELLRNIAFRHDDEIIHPYAATTHSQLHHNNQGFPKNCSTIDAVFVVRQVVEKAVEYHQPAQLCVL